MYSGPFFTLVVKKKNRKEEEEKDCVESRVGVRVFCGGDGPCGIKAPRIQLKDRVLCNYGVMEHVLYYQSGGGGRGGWWVGVGVWRGVTFCVRARERQRERERESDVDTFYGLSLIHI